jgi:hypothetical protein
MVRALLDGRKTQTRRIVKPQTDDSWDDFTIVAEHYTPVCFDKKGEAYPGTEVFGFGSPEQGWKSPYGEPGDRLWVRETSIIAPKRWSTPDSSSIKDSDGDHRQVQYIATHPCTEAADDYKLKKTPSIFMPRWASRITLEITNIRVERLNDISDEDAKSEGTKPFTTDFLGEGHAKACYADLWNEINGTGSWDKNPWVWVIEFQRINTGGSK